MVRTGYETFTTACLHVTYDQDRADAGLPPWASDDGGQYFLDSEVTETTASEDDRRPGPSTPPSR
jgi:hypothetical protein